MQFGLQLNSQHLACENMPDRLRELREQVRLAQAVGFHSIVAPQHYLPAPFQMFQPLPLLARMAPEALQMRLIAGIMLLSLPNPIALAEDIGTLDAICNGQFTLGVALGDRDTALRTCLPYLGVEIPDLSLLGSIRGITARRRSDLPFDELRDQRFIIGSPDDCVEQLHLYHQCLGAHHFLLRVQWAGMPQKQVLEAITLVGERIIPHLRTV